MSIEIKVNEYQLQAIEDAGIDFTINFDESTEADYPFSIEIAESDHAKVKEIIRY